MKSLQRLQQQILGQADDIVQHYAITPRAARLYQELKRHAHVVVGSVAFGSAALLGPDIPQLPNTSDNTTHAINAQVLYDKHRELLIAKENVISLKRIMVQSSDGSEATLQILADDLRQAKETVRKLETEFQQMTSGTPDEDVDTKEQRPQFKMKS